METTYRSLLTWGEPEKAQSLDQAIRELARARLGLSAEDLEGKHLEGLEPVRLDRPCQLPASFVEALRALHGPENVKTDDLCRARFAHAKHYQELLRLRMGQILSPPDAVVSPRSEAEVEELVRLCHREGVPLVPMGGRSSVTRATETPKGGIALDMTKHMNKVLEISEKSLTVRVQAGMYGPAFEGYLNHFNTGYTCGHFPQSFEHSTVGGWVAAKGAGQASTGYGRIDDMVLALRVVTPSGTIATKPYPASAQGWDLHRLFIGSEGTLGVITEVTLKIRAFLPQNTAYATLLFKNFAGAVEAMRQIVQSQYAPPHLFRLSDPEETEVAFRLKGFDDSFNDRLLQTLGFHQGQRCIMFVGCEGDKNKNKALVRHISRLARRFDGIYIGEKPTRKWLEQRYASAYLRDPLMDAGVMTDTIETAATWDQLLTIWEEARSYLKARPKTICMTHISHVYENGANLYFTFLSPMAKGKELLDYQSYHKGLVNTLTHYGGSLSHHHGVGRALAAWMPQEIGPAGMALMKAIKQHLDPKGIMNPGNVLGLDEA